MHDVGRVELADHREVADERFEEPLVPGIARGQLHVGVDAEDAGMAIGIALVAETEDIHRIRPAVQSGQFAREVLDVDAGAAVDVRRVFVREKGDAHRAGEPRVR